MRIVRNRSIPHVDDDRLYDSLEQIHHKIHTQEGLHSWDSPRHNLVDWGIKARLITAELTKRGHSLGTCRFCWKHP